MKRRQEEKVKTQHPDECCKYSLARSPSCRDKENCQEQTQSNGCRVNAVPKQRKYGAGYQNGNRCQRIRKPYSCTLLEPHSTELYPLLCSVHLSERIDIGIHSVSSVYSIEQVALLLKRAALTNKLTRKPGALKDNPE